MPMQVNQGKISKVFVFLLKNFKFNRELQACYFVRTFAGTKSKADCVKRLLHETMSSRPNGVVRDTALLIQRFCQNSKIFDNLESIDQLSEAISKHLLQQSGPYAKPVGMSELDWLWEVARQLGGWGEKTAALFVKSVYLTHCLPELKSYRFIARYTPNSGDTLYVPVDTVIKHIFDRHLVQAGGPSTFKDINAIFRSLKSSGSMVDSNGCESNRFVVWDDLWFWGFITQAGGGNKRTTAVNMDKYDALLCASCSDREKIANLAKEFIDIIR